MKKFLIACGVFAATVNGVAQAQTLEYDCDTQAEHYSVLKATQSGPDYAVSGNISLREIFAVKDYVTLGVLDFEPQDHSWKARLGLQALMAGKKPVIVGVLEITRNDKTEEPQIVGDVLEFQKGQSYPIRFDLGANGGTATLGSHSLPVKVPAAGKLDVSVVCSGGEFLFTDLKLSN